MRVLELFSGKESFSKACRRRGYKTFTIDNDPQFEPDLCADIMDIDVDTIIDVYDAGQIIKSPPVKVSSKVRI